MKKRNFSICFIFAAAALGIFFFPKKKTEEPEAEKTRTTWDSFQDYKRLEMLVKGFAIESMIDIPCLETERLKKNLGLKRYIGVAPTRDRARALQAQFGSEEQTYLNFAVDVDVLPKSDLILCWDELCRLPSSRAQSALVQYKKSGCKFLLMRHFPEVKKNHKNKAGGFQPVNWTLPPYNLPEPIIQILEEGQYGMESLALWNLEKL